MLLIRLTRPGRVKPPREARGNCNMDGAVVHPRSVARFRSGVEKDRNRDADGVVMAHGGIARSWGKDAITFDLSRG